LKKRDAALREVILTDVCPYTLGVEIAQSSESGFEEGFFMPLIERNTVIPASRIKQIGTIHDGQTRIDLKIFQGESRLVKDNIFLGRMQLKIPPKPKGQEIVDVRFTYDINGLLEVDATVVSTGVKKTIVIEENPGVLSQVEIQKRLASLNLLKIHPRDQVENRTLLARAERMYEEFLGATRERIGIETNEFSRVLSRQNPREVEMARTRFADFLNMISEDSPFTS
jgi:molecular chaperone HscC